MYKFGSVQKRLLIALLGGIALGISSSPRQYFNTFRKIQTDWKRASQDSFRRSIGSLSREKLVEEKRRPDGSFSLILTEKGKREAQKLSLIGGFTKLKKPKKWDKKWRIVIFDIPEKDKIFRNILREHLKELDFFKLQNSVFVSPHPFEKIISELAELYSAKYYVKIITALKIDDEKRIRKHFSIK